jgi:hypothetical protein
MKPKRPTEITLECPECSQENAYAEAALVPGRLLECLHCGAELVVSHDRDTPDDPPVWRLETPDADEDRPQGA